MSVLAAVLRWRPVWWVVGIAVVVEVLRRSGAHQLVPRAVLLAGCAVLGLAVVYALRWSDPDRVSGAQRAQARFVGGVAAIGAMFSGLLVFPASLWAGGVPSDLLPVLFLAAAFVVLGAVAWWAVRRPGARLRAALAAAGAEEEVDDADADEVLDDEDFLVDQDIAGISLDDDGEGDGPGRQEG